MKLTNTPTEAETIAAWERDLTEPIQPGSLAARMAAFRVLPDEVEALATSLPFEEFGPALDALIEQRKRETA